MRFYDHVFILLFVSFCTVLFLFVRAWLVAWLVGFARLSATCHCVTAVSNLFPNLFASVCVCSSSFSELVGWWNSRAVSVGSAEA